jgi:hypothetical protein
MAEERFPVGFVAFPDVGLKEVAHEGDPAVPVVDQMGGGGEGPPVIVRLHHRAFEAGDLVADHDDGLALMAQMVEVLVVDRVEHHDEAVHPLPGGVLLVPRHPGGVAAHAQVEGLDGHHPGARLPSHPGDAGQHPAEERAAEQG